MKKFKYLVHINHKNKTSFLTSAANFAAIWVHRLPFLLPINDEAHPGGGDNAKPLLHLEVLLSAGRRIKPSQTRDDQPSTLSCP
jgi:hypothetical protein